MCNYFDMNCIYGVHFYRNMENFVSINRNHWSHELKKHVEQDDELFVHRDGF